MYSLIEAKKLNEEINSQERWVVKMAVEYTRTNSNLKLLDAVYTLRSLYNKRKINQDELAEKFQIPDVD